MKKIVFGLTIALLPWLAYSQTDTTKAAEEFNFEEFGDADTKEVKAFCTQKVNYLSPTKLISVGYEAQLPFHLKSVGLHEGGGINITTAQTHVNRFGGFRLGVNTPVVSRSNFILNLGLTYWNTRVALANPERSANLFGNLQALNSAGINATVFKPFDNVHFLIIQANADLNSNYLGVDNISKGLTFSGTAIYGWKKNDNFMWGLGITRTYRAGQLLHIPVVLYNRTFNQKWGVEGIFPAKVNIRRNFSPTSYILLGYEIEGNAYYLGNTTGSELHLRRGELKPRITFEKQLSGFVWLSAQAGLRYNWRFNVFNTQNPVKDQKPLFENTLGNSLYFNVSINLVSP